MSVPSERSLEAMRARTGQLLPVFAATIADRLVAEAEQALRQRTSSLIRKLVDAWDFAESNVDGEFAISASEHHGPPWVDIEDLTDDERVELRRIVEGSDT